MLQNRQNNFEQQRDIPPQVTIQEIQAAFVHASHVANSVPPWSMQAVWQQCAWLWQGKILDSVLFRQFWVSGVDDAQ